MTKTTKNLTINIVLLVLTYVMPLYIFRQYQNDYINIDFVQKSTFIVLLCGSMLLTYINHKNRIRIQNFKWLWVAFEILGILGVIYSAVVLGLIFVFRHGIGF